MDESYDVVVIGGGFYGLYLAEFLASRAGRVLLCEQGTGLMQRASYANQARVHNGYHYPRSMLTSVRSRINFPRFIEEFPSAIKTDFENVYAIGRYLSKINSSQFAECMRRIGAFIRPAPKTISSLFDHDRIDAVFLVEEHVFDSIQLRDIMTERVAHAGVDVRLQTTVSAVRAVFGGAVRVELQHSNGPSTVTADHVFACSYSHLNAVGAHSGLPLVALKHELTEMALIEVPERLRCLGVTVMDGPFFSLMPFPARGLHTLSHVRYTPHAHWHDGKGEYRSGYELLNKTERRSAFPHMVSDAKRYLPSVAESIYRDSLWEVKTILPRSETDDSRPILFQPHFGVPGYHLVMGGKIDNVYDVVDEVALMFGWPRK